MQGIGLGQTLAIMAIQESPPRTFCQALTVWQDLVLLLSECPHPQLEVVCVWVCGCVSVWVCGCVYVGVGVLCVGE